MKNNVFSHWDQSIEQQPAALLFHRSVRAAELTKRYNSNA